MPLSRKLAGLAGWILTAMLISAAVTIGACNRAGVDIDKITPGTEVTLTRQDGGVVQGPVERVEENTVVVRVGERAMTVPRSDISSIQVQEAGVAKALPPAAKYREFVVPTGTTLSLKLMTKAGTETSRVEDAVTAELTEAVMIDGVEVLPVGTAVSGSVLRTELRFHTIRAGIENYAIGIKSGIPAAAGVPAGTVLKLMLDRDVEVKVSLKADY